MSDVPKKLVVDLATGTQQYIDLTPEEIAQREVDAQAAAIAKAEADAEAQAKADDPENTDENATALAFDIVMKAEEMKQAEQELRDLFSLTGRIDLYYKLCEEREKIVGNRLNAQKQKKLAEAAIKRKKEATLQKVEIAFAIIFAFIIVIGICGVTYWVLFDENSPFVQETKKTKTR